MFREMNRIGVFPAIVSTVLLPPDYHGLATATDAAAAIAFSYTFDTPAHRDRKVRRSY